MEKAEKTDTWIIGNPLSRVLWREPHFVYPPSPWRSHINQRTVAFFELPTFDGPPINCNPNCNPEVNIWDKMGISKKIYHLI
jgi:hypothetical protein